jgi:hypothetical protein
MRFTKLWLALGILCFVVVVLLFGYEFIRGNLHWCWNSLVQLETGVMLAGLVGAALLIVVAVEHWWKR